ncbi:molybdopterin converting factor subunit 1 [Spirosoma horti]
MLRSADNLLLYQTALPVLMTQSVSVLLFGITRDLTGQSAVAVPLSEGASVGDLLSQLHQAYPALAGIRSLLVAVNGEYAEPEQLLAHHDEIALIPPVSGG